MPTAPKPLIRFGLNAKKTFALLGMVISTLAITGCGNTATNASRLANANLEASGSPFRWTTESVKGGWITRLTLPDLPAGRTKADAILQADILKIIARQEAAANRPAPHVESVKHLKDGREVWVLQSTIDSNIAYVVALIPTPETGGVDIKLQGPTLYSK